MKFGISVYDVTASEVVEIAVAAEAAGFDSLWLGEHLLLPAGYDAVHPTKVAAEERAAPIVAAETRLTDPLLALAAAAARTERIHLATGIYLANLRHPLVTARAAVTLQDLAGGRFVLGVGAGWLREEFEALGVPFAARGARLEEGLGILRRAWRGGVFDHHGEFFDFAPVQVTAAEVHVPLILGGNTAPALRRAARWGDGWFSSANPSLPEAVAYRDQLQAWRREQPDDRPFSVYVRVADPVPADVVRYADEGFDHLVFWAHELCPPGSDRWARMGPAAERLGVATARDRGGIR